VFVVDDKKDSIEGILSADMPALPQPEPMFDVRHIKNNGLKGSYRLARCIVFFDSSTTLSVSHNREANPQLIVKTNGSNAKALQNAIVKFEMNNEFRKLKQRHNSVVDSLVKKMFNINSLTPLELKNIKTAKNFLWTSNNTAEGMKNIVIFKAKGNFPYSANDVLKTNIPGETDDMYMQIATIADSTEGIWRGLWEMKNDAMGGPYVCRKVRETYILAFVYAPERKKRNLMRQLEAAVLTFGHIAKS